MKKFIPNFVHFMPVIFSVRHVRGSTYKEVHMADFGNRFEHVQVEVIDVYG